MQIHNNYYATFKIPGINIPKLAISQSEAYNVVYCPDILRYQVTDLISHDFTRFWAEFGYGKYLNWSLHGLSHHGLGLAKLVAPGVFESRQNTNNGSTKLACYATEAYQKGTIRYKYQ